MQHEVLAILAEAHDYNSYLEKLETPGRVFANYEDQPWMDSNTLKCT